MTRLEAERETSKHWLAALRYRDFRLLLTGEIISATGTEMFYVAMSWQMYLLTHSALALGLLGLAGFIPAMLFSLFGGNFADAHNRKKILYVTQPIFMLCSALLAMATFTHAITPLIIYILAAIVAATVAFDHPARTALIPNLVDRKDFTNTLSVYETFEQIARITGPLIAGFLIAGIGVGFIYGLDAFSTIAVLLALLLMRHAGEPAGEKSVVSLKSITEGLTFVRSKVLLWSSILIDFFATFFALAMALLPIFANEILHVGPQGLGLLYAAPSLGAIIAGFFMTLNGHVRFQGRTMLVAVALFGMATILFGLSHVYILSVLALALIGGFDSVSVIMRENIQQLATPDSMRGRVSSIAMIFWMGGPQLGEFEAGLLAALIGAQFSVVIGGVATIVFVGMVAMLIPALRKYQANR
jgi:MFS family permease